MRRLI